MDSADAVLLVRRLDGLIYRFEREPDDWNGAASFRRTDLPLWIRRTSSGGWAVMDGAGIANGWPVVDAPDSPEPPQAAWRSEKGVKSYLYDLRQVAAQAADDSPADDTPTDSSGTDDSPADDEPTDSSGTMTAQRTASRRGIVGDY